MLSHTENLNMSSQNINLVGLYQEILVEHSKKPRFKVSQKPSSCMHCQEGKNPLCGDEITLFLNVESLSDRSLLSAQFLGSGCSICMASSSMLCEKIQSVSYFEAKSFCEYAESIYSGKAGAVTEEDDIEEDLQALSGVAKFPVRVKCAALAWKTLELALGELFTESGELKCNISESRCAEKVVCRKQSLKVIS